MQFITELIIRLGEKTPGFFKIIRTVAAIITIITGALAFIRSIPAVHLPSILDFVGSYDASISAFIVSFISSLPVDDPAKLKEKLAQ